MNDEHENPAPDEFPAVEPEGSHGAPGSEDTMRAAADRIGELETELTEMRERWMRSEAEAQNIRARAKRDVDDARQYAVQKFARDVVEAAENLRRGLSSLPAPAEHEDPMVTKLREGFEGVERSFIGILERNGIVAADPTGERFDANLHQAMAEQPSDQPPGTVVAAWTKAWTLNGRLLKPAMVVVSSAASPGLDTSA
jgi:molecular chaperone GrpE